MGTVAAPMLRSSRHDYQYYPSRWYDESTGTQYEAGYYDENGQYYKNVAIRNGSEFETALNCEYCGTQIKLKWTEGAIPSCPNCGASLKEVADNSVIEDKLQDQIVSAPSSNIGRRFLRIALTMLVCMCFLPMMMFACMRKFASSKTSTGTAYEQEANSDDSIYIDVLGRYCYWDDEYECYYDEETDCYFVYADNVNPPEWQYWFEGVSSDYGDYGWMSYHYDEGLWYIETSNGHWEVLPSSYDASALWHVPEMGTGKYNEQNSIYVESIGRTCEWIPEEESYYDPETDCYFYYNDYVEPPVWQYWFGGISDQFGDYGVMEYDPDEERWYVETDDGWEELPSEYDRDYLWFIE